MLSERAGFHTRGTKYFVEILKYLWKNANKRKKENWCFHRSVAEYRSLLNHYAMSIGKYSPTFRRIITPSSGSANARSRLFLDYLSLTMKELRSFERSVTMFQSMRTNVAKDLYLQKIKTLSGRPHEAHFKPYWLRVRQMLCCCAVCREWDFMIQQHDIQLVAWTERVMAGIHRIKFAF
jgi:hypothetical protein